MSKTSVDIAMERIKAAQPNSPILVHTWPEQGFVGTVFYDTVATRKQLHGGELTVVGVYTKDSDLAKAREAIHAAAWRV